MTSRRANGEGSIYKRADGRWGASVYVETSSGQRKRIHIYAGTRQEVHDRLADKLAEARKGIRTPDKEWTVGGYLDYWLREVVTANDRPRTVELYESVIRLHLKPKIGSIRLTKLSVRDVQSMLNQQLEQGRSLRSAHLARGVLRAALSRAEREELIIRNVAKLVTIRAWKRKPIQPWSADEAARFLKAAQPHRWYGAYAMLLIYGMRRGEVLGLRWCDVDLARNQLHVRQQLQRIGKTLEQGPVKTDAGQRDLSLTPSLRATLVDLYVSRYSTDIDIAAMPARMTEDHRLVSLSTTGTPVDPKNFVRDFHQIRTTAGLPHITVHHTRHTEATLLKNFKVPARDAQLILGHAHVTTTQQLYQHADHEGQAEALEQIERRLLTPVAAAKTAANDEFSTGDGTIFHAFTSGGPGGARTLDTLLKSLTLSSDSTGSTPVLTHLRTHAYAHMLAWVAVKNCCKFTPCEETRESNLADWIKIIRALEHFETQSLAQQRFPLNLLPTSRLPLPQSPLNERARKTVGDQEKGRAA
ncbi:tyrosine-type recombinase/integrase [Amycolatopsis sp. H20-H5]|uniref:tyrosine-type recombinase/integrase n=1 Tax=Amycolatopsis sp. H20-H5 TaxID=3046309 RepID=UPI002DBEAB1C|nr:site-specific integrase [Amycolatopsis sp. H20-H5]MEC3979630.1 site-specific integrase [Amycolatopsis sp. H20-H5]